MAELLAFSYNLDGMTTRIAFEMDIDKDSKEKEK
jgi:hypothetical protein